MKIFLKIALFMGLFWHLSAHSQYERKVILLEKWKNAPSKTEYQVKLNVFILKPSQWTIDLILPRIKRVAESFSQAGITIEASIYQVETQKKFSEMPSMYVEDEEEKQKSIFIRDEFLNMLDSNYTLSDSVNLVYLQTSTLNTAYAAWNKAYPLNTVAWIPFNIYGQIGFKPAYGQKENLTFKPHERYFVDTHEIGHILFETGHDFSKSGYIMSFNNYSSYFSKENIENLFRNRLLKKMEPKRKYELYLNLY